VSDEKQRPIAISLPAANTTWSNLPGAPRLTRAPGHHVQTDIQWAPITHMFTYINGIIMDFGLIPL